VSAPIADRARDPEAARLAVPSVADPLARVRDPLLRAAALRVADAWLADGDEPDGAGVVVVELGRLAAAVESGDPTSVPEGDAAEGLRRRLLPALRREVERAWLAAATPPSAAEMLRTLRAFEGLAGTSQGRRPPEGLDMIVELAHDLRSPLTSILFLSETMRKGQSGGLSALQHRQMGLIYSAALGMVSLASDLIELAQGGERLVDAHETPFAVSDVMSSVCDLVQPLAEEKKLTLRCLPPPVDHRIGHPAALSRVLLNLASNALRFTDDGFVEITAHPRGLSRLEFAVRDTGPGIKPEARSSLFAPFRPGRGGDRYGFSGAGLGLAICRRLVRAMGSELRYETLNGWGTRFYFEVELPPASP
jgi:signal transduction histidine kinase